MPTPAQRPHQLDRIHHHCNRHPRHNPPRLPLNRPIHHPCHRNDMQRKPSPPHHVPIPRYKIAQQLGHHSQNPEQRKSQNVIAHHPHAHSTSPPPPTPFVIRPSSLIRISGFVLRISFDTCHSLSVLLLQLQNKFRTFIEPLPIRLNQRPTMIQKVRQYLPIRI